MFDLGGDMEQHDQMIMPGQARMLDGAMCRLMFGMRHRLQDKKLSRVLSHAHPLPFLLDDVASSNPRSPLFLTSLRGGVDCADLR